MPSSAQARSSRTREIMESCGALMTGDHFVYASGEHGDGWIAKDLVNLDPKRPQELSAMLAEAVRAAAVDPEVVCAPAIGGVICGQYTANALGCVSIFAERTDDRQAFALRRRYDQVVADKRVLLVDDIINTGYSTGLVKAAVEDAGGIVVGVATWINRGNVGAEDFGVAHFICLDEVVLPSIPAESCPHCAASVPVNIDYAHGREYVAGKQG